MRGMLNKKDGAFNTLLLLFFAQMATGLTVLRPYSNHPVHPLISSRQPSSPSGSFA